MDSLAGERLTGTRKTAGNKTDTPLTGANAVRTGWTGKFVNPAMLSDFSLTGLACPPCPYIRADTDSSQEGSWIRAPYRRRMKDFSKPRNQIQFRIDDDVFDAAPAIPAETLAEFASRFTNLEAVDPGERFGILSEALDLVLLPESFARLRSRMRDKTDPVEMDQLSDIIVWLLGEYGLRPTQQSSSSSDGRHNPESGLNLMDAAHPGESISALSPQAVS